MADAQPEMSASARKKLEKKQAKEAKKAEGAAKRAAEQAAQFVTEGENFGTLPIMQSKEKAGRTFVQLKDLSQDYVGKEVLIRARLQNARIKGNLGFLLLRQRFHTVQGVLSVGEKITKPMLKFVASVPNESIVEITGTVVSNETKVEKASISDMEINLMSFYVFSRSEPLLPIQIEDAERPKPDISAQKKELKRIQALIEEAEAKLAAAAEGDKGQLQEEVQKLKKDKEAANKFVILGKATRLDNRIIDLRTAANQAVFRVQSGICQLFREFLSSKGFTEIHTPKMIACASEGGAEVFEIKYFDGKAYLAQSPQLFKQMAICADMERVFEVGPVFRAEKSFTHRHLTEFTGLDLEMTINEHYHEALDMLEGMLLFVFNGLKERYAVEIAAVKRQYPFEDLVYPTVPRLTFPEGVKMLRDAGEEIGDYDDLSTPLERRLGELVKEKYGTDFFMLDKYPYSVRPFYTMRDPVDGKYSNSYDLFMRGQEICSGAQRVHDPEMLRASAQEKGVGLDGIRAYVDAFRFGAPPHAGGGIGLERVAMLFLDIGSVKRTSMFPRDPSRLNP